MHAYTVYLVTVCDCCVHGVTETERLAVVVVVAWQAEAQLPNLESYLDNIAYELENVEPALSADSDSLTQQITEIRVSRSYGSP